MKISARRLLQWVLFCSLIPAAGCLTPRSPVVQDWEESIQQARTMRELSGVFRRGPETCVDANEQYQICTWIHDERQPSYIPISWFLLPFQTGGMISAVCELPRDGSPREADSCDVNFRAR